MRSNQFINALPVLGLTLAVLALPLVAGAGECPLEEAPAVPSTQTEALPDSTAGMRVVIDPETGALRAPTAEEGAALFGIPDGQLPEKSEAQEPAIERPDGSLLLQFRGSFLKAAVATVGEDGKVVLDYHAASVAMPSHMVVNPPAVAAQETAQETAQEATQEATPEATEDKEVAP
jgi:hypothetical protein